MILNYTPSTFYTIILGYSTTSSCFSLLVVWSEPVWLMFTSGYARIKCELIIIAMKLICKTAHKTCYIYLTSKSQCAKSSKFLGCYVRLQAEGNHWHHLQLPYFHLKNLDPDSQQTKTTVSAPLTAAMLNGLCSDRWYSVASFVCFHTKASQTWTTQWCYHRENTQPHVDSHPTFTHTGCGTDFVNVDMYTWSTTVREDHTLILFKIRVLRKILPPKRDEVTGEWWRLLSQKFHNLYSSSNMKSRITWSGQVACKGRAKGHTAFCWANMKETGHFQDLGIYMEI